MSETKKKGGLFDGLSVFGIIGGALGAVTSMLAGTEMGIAGTAVGVGLGSVISALSTHIYSKILESSKEKIAHTLPFADGSVDEAPRTERGAAWGGATTAVMAPVSAATIALPASRVSPGASAPNASSASTVVMPAVSAATAELAGQMPSRTANHEASRRAPKTDSARKFGMPKRAMAGVAAAAVAAALISAGTSAVFMGTLAASENIGHADETVLEAQDAQADASASAATGAGVANGTTVSGGMTEAAPQASAAAADDSSDAQVSATDQAERGSSAVDSTDGTVADSNAEAGQATAAATEEPSSGQATDAETSATTATSETGATPAAPATSTDASAAAEEPAA
ncbi:hypothetical protein [Slackia heliotrinireducens]|uniref:hypothetical protein n=1 Tax=Slackia heliotrinireducens TaxID=84110 RepID=UPI003314DA19